MLRRKQKRRDSHEKNHRADPVLSAPHQLFQIKRSAGADHSFHTDSRAHTEKPPGRSTVSKIPVNIFVPDKNAEHLITIPTVINREDDDLIVALLTEYSMLHEEIVLNSIALYDTQLDLDFNQAFLDQLRSWGTAGERMITGCVVNTFLSVYAAETVYITVDEDIMQSAHVIYDFPMGFLK